MKKVILDSLNTTVSNSTPPKLLTRHQIEPYRNLSGTKLINSPSGPLELRGLRAVQFE